jgi:NAD(P)H-dependent flavin oxidoreductase YrpB (nitropropane dioxygenase family)
VLIIAVNNLAGGHRNLAPEALIKVNLNTTLPVISAGGVSKSDLDKMVSYGA